MAHKLVGLACLLLAMPVVAQVPQAGWPQVYSPPPGGTIPSTVADVDGDGLPEIIVHHFDTGVYVYDGDGTLLPGWPFGPNPVSGSWALRRRPLVGDIDGDGVVEIVYLSIGNQVVALTPQGTLKPGWPVTLPLLNPSSFEALGDVNGDGVLEVVVIGHARRNPLSNLQVIQAVHALDGSGQHVPGFPATISWGSYPALFSFFGVPPTVADVDFDGRSEIVVKITVYDANDNQYPGSITILNGDGSLRPGWPISPPQNGVMFESLVADLDGDHRPEIITPGQHQLLVHRANGTGSPLAGSGGSLYPPLVGTPNGIRFNNNAVGDLDGDGDLEVLLVAFNHLVRWDPGGEMGTWHTQSSGPYQDYRGVSIADVDGDGEAEIACWTSLMHGSPQLAVHLMDHDFNDLPGWPVFLNPYSSHDSSEYVTHFADLDGDQDLELIHLHGATIHVWDIPRTGPGPVRVEWGQLGHDAQNSNFYHAGAVQVISYLRGDASLSGVLELDDVPIILAHMFQGTPHPCRALMDLNEDGKLDLADPFRLLFYLFDMAPAPVSNFPACQGTPAVPLPCEVYACP